MSDTIFSLADFSILLKNNFDSFSLGPLILLVDKKKTGSLNSDPSRILDYLGEKTMKKLKVMMALAAVTTLASVQAEDAVCGAKKQEATASNKASDEQAFADKVKAFASKLNEQNRQAFDKFTVDQKKAAVASTMQPNDAVQKVLKDQNVTAAEKAEVKAAAPAPAKAK
jgi:hypothetical protein